MTSLKPAEHDVLTISDLRRSLDVEAGKAIDHALFVLNTSDLGGSRKRGDLLIVVEKAGGRTETVTLVETWIPVDLSQFARKGDIINSLGFMQQVNAGTITPVTTEFAEQCNKRADVRETRNLIAIKARGGAAAQGAPTQLPGGITMNQPITAAQAMQQTAQAQADDELNINPRVLQIMETDDASLAPALKLTSLKALVSEIRQRELRYVMSKCDASPGYEPIQRWVTEMNAHFGRS